MSFPVLEVLAARTGNHQPGQRIPLGGSIRFGRAREADVTLHTPHVSRFHCGVFNELGGWWLRDLGSANGITLWGERVQEVELAHGHFFEVARGHVYEFLTHEREPELIEPSMEAAIRAHPDDARLWSVYADWLQERGVALGDVLLREGSSAGELRSLGPVAGDVMRGELQVDWAHGLPRRLVMRSWQGDFGDWSLMDRLGSLSRSPGLRFLRELELDLGSFRRQDIQDEQQVKQVVDALGTSLPMLERLVITPARVFSVEGLTNRYEVALKPYRPARLEVLEVRPDVRLHLQSTDSDRVLPGLPGSVSGIDARGVILRLSGAVQISVALTQTNDLWSLERTNDGPAGLLHVNGILVGRCFLRAGDLIELAPGVQLRFDC